MPYPNEHSARQKDPGEFDPESFRRKEISPGISIIVGKLKGQDSMTVQSVRFDAAQHHAMPAKKWLEDSGYSPSSFVAATGGGKSVDGPFGFLGGAVKALGSGKIGGYLVTFGTPQDGDLSRYRDFFDAKTDFAVKSYPASSAVYYHHGIDDTLGRRRLADESEVKAADNVGHWIEAQLKMRDDWEQAVYRMAEEGKLNWSSGTAHHLVERTPVEFEGKTVHHVDYWPIGLDATVTPTPADWRNQVYALKSVEVKSLRELVEGGREDRPSLPELTERWLEDGEQLIAKYRDVHSAEVKIGKPMSSARVERLKNVHQMMGDAHVAMGDILSEVSGSDAPATGSASIPASISPDIERELLRLRTRTMMGGIR